MKGEIRLWKCKFKLILPIACPKKPVSDAPTSFFHTFIILFFSVMFEGSFSSADCNNYSPNCPLITLTAARRCQAFLLHRFQQLSAAASITSLLAVKGPPMKRKSSTQYCNQSVSQNMDACESGFLTFFLHCWKNSSASNQIHQGCQLLMQSLKAIPLQGGWHLVGLSSEISNPAPRIW